jgi:methylmalonyl-CoA mutase
LRNGKRQVEKATGKTLEQLVSATMEHIDVKPLYTRDDIKDLQHLGYVAGVPPFLRGPYPAMYVTQPWTVRQYAGFSTAEESNAFYRRNWPPGRRACPSPSIWPPIAVTTPIMAAWSAMSARRAWRLIRCWI